MTLQEQRVKRHGFGEGHADDGLHEDFSGGTRITTDAFNGFGSDETDADGGRKASEGALNASCDFSDVLDHGIFIFFIGWISVVRAGHAPDGKESVSRIGVTVGFGMVVAMITDQADVDTYQKRENERLNEADQQFQKVEWNRKSPPGHGGHGV